MNKLSKIVCTAMVVFFVMVGVGSAEDLTADDLNLMNESNHWLLHTPNDGRTEFNIVPAIGGSPDYSNKTIFKDNGDFSVSGSVGIGTTNPLVKLHVNGKIFANENVGIGTTTSYGGKLVIQADAVPLTLRQTGRAVDDGGLWRMPVDDGTLRFDVNTGPEGDTFGSNYIPVLKMTQTGNVTIGTLSNSGNYKLNVCGSIKATEVVVNSSCADYVFEDDYKLKSLEEVSKYIEKEKHLPGIPSAKEVQENGMGLSHMQTKLLEKVEELTLYMIEMKKENQQIKKQNQQFKERLAAVEGGIR